MEVRENKLVQLSKDNVHLQETTNILRRFVENVNNSLEGIWKFMLPVLSLKLMLNC